MVLYKALEVVNALKRTKQWDIEGLILDMF